MLRLEDLDVHYGHFKAVDQVSLRVAKGELVVLLGANGAGKSSIFHAISGLNQCSGGTIEYDGMALHSSSPAQIAAHGVVQCPEGRELFPQMSVEKNLMLGAYLYRKERGANLVRLEQVMDMFPVLREKRSQAAGSLSGGQQQMVAIGRALMGRPRLLLLDEPSLGLAPLVVKSMFEVIRTINQQGTTVLLAEQNAHAALRIANRAYVVELGRIVLEGSADELLGNELVRRAYIGA